MIVAIMQPYFFPYIGYFQLMRAVDVFVFYDDVQFMKGGWVNRNRILVAGHVNWLTLPVVHDSVKASINQRSYVLNESVRSVKRKLQAVYADAKAFQEVYVFVSDLLDFQDPNVAAFNANILRLTAKSLGINCRFAASSEVAKPEDLRGEARVIHLCKALGADQYINPIGGTALYQPSMFAESGIRISFLQTTASPTPTASGPQHLSVVDGLMREGFDAYKQRLSEYRLLEKADAWSRT